MSAVSSAIAQPQPVALSLTGEPPLPTNPEQTKMLRDFIATYRLYRRHHPMRYALSRAWGIVVKGQDF